MFQNCSVHNCYSYNRRDVFEKSIVSTKSKWNDSYQFSSIKKSRWPVKIFISSLVTERTQQICRCSILLNILNTKKNAK